MLVFYEENNDEHMAIYLEMGVANIWKWKRKESPRYELWLEGWNMMCKGKTNADIPEGVEIQRIKKKDKYVRSNQRSC